MFCLLVLRFWAAIFAFLPQTEFPFSDWKELQGPYLGQKPPGMIPEIFAPGIVSTDFYNHSSVTMSPDGKEIYWAMGPLDHPLRIYSSKWTANGWDKPQIVSFTRDLDGDCPVLSPDGSRLYFNSNRPLIPGGSMRERYWYAERNGEEWSSPQPLGMKINGKHLHWQASVDRQGNFYFGSEREGTLGRDDIFIGSIGEVNADSPISLGSPLNTELHEGCPFVSPDGSYMVFGGRGLSVSFKQRDGSWSVPKSLGEEFDGTCPYVSPDGKYLFFLKMGMGYNDVYWVDSSVVFRTKSG